VIIGLTYACVSPLIILPCMFFFAYGGLVYRHQLLFVYRPQYESGGALWPVVYRRYIFSLFTAQATLVGMLLLKQVRVWPSPLDWCLLLPRLFPHSPRPPFTLARHTAPRKRCSFS